MSDSKSPRKKRESTDEKIDKWLLEIRKLYEKDGKINDFNKEEECLRAYLVRLKKETKPSGRLSICKLKEPYRKGGTGIVFKASHKRLEKQELALKFNRPMKKADTRALVENELRILPQLEHSNVIRVIDIGEFDIESDENLCPSLSFLLEPFIPEAIDLREYAESLAHFGKEVTDNLLDGSLLKLTYVLRQWIEALNYLQKLGFVHLDVKPDNAIVDKYDHLVMIDFGTVQVVDLEDSTPTEIFFSEPYAHPRIKTERFERTSTNRVRTAVKRSTLTFDLDYYALGKSILELLETISIYHSHDFPQRPLFKSLHFLATRLLDGQNKKSHVQSVIWIREKVSLDEVFDGLEEEDYTTIKYENLEDTLRDIDKELGNWDPENIVPELETYPPSSLRVVPDINTALTQRLLSLTEHPLVARLKTVSQLGLNTLVYLTADHSRYDHILGAYTYTACYVKALFNDSQNCMFRNLINEDDIKATLLASLLHDLGQYPLAHDLQEVQPRIFDHTSLSIDLLYDETRDRHKRTLLDLIQNPEYGWGVELGRLKRILQAHSGQVRLLEVQTVQDFKADMLSALIDGPIDADKADYIMRDSTGCRIPYGRQLDIERLLSVLTTVRIPKHFREPHRVTIGIYEKGIASASAFSLARYLLFASVYWHHAARILKTMLQYATVMILPNEVFGAYPDEDRIKEIRQKLLQFIRSSLIPSTEQMRTQIKPRVSLEKKKLPIAAEPSGDVLKSLTKLKREMYKGWYPGMSRTDWLMLNWLKEVSTTEQSELGVALIDLILQRQLYKRVYTMHHDKTVETMNLFSRLKDLKWLAKVKLCENMSRLVYDMIRKRGPSIPTLPHPPSDKVREVFSENLAILVDIPSHKRFVPDRPLLCVSELQSKTYYSESPAESYLLNESLDSLMKLVSPVRVLCHPSLRQWIGACITPDEMRYVISSALDRAR